MPKIITKLGLDQIRFILRFEDINHQSLKDESNTDTLNYKAVWEHIHSCTHDLKPGAKHWESKKGPMTHSDYPLDGGSKLYVALGWSSQAGYHFMIAQFNPSKLTDMGAVELEAAFACMFDGGYAEFFERAECSSIEVPLDVFGVKFADCLYFDTRLKSVNDFHEEDGTLYLGRRNSRYVSVYDKAKEIADKGGSVFNGHWLRIEPRLCPGIPATEIAHLPSAFATVSVIDKQKLAGIKHQIAVNVFRDRVFNLGAQPQAAFLMAPNRKGLVEGLQQAIPDWYNPIEIWKTFPAAAHRISPAGLHSIAGSPHVPTHAVPTAEDVSEAIYA